MNIFNRKRKNNTEIEIIPPKHEHTYKDFPWYMEEEYNGQEHTAKYRIVEPYVCITCGHRIDKILEYSNWSGVSADTREKEYTRIRNRYKKYLKPRAVVEDMINNVLLVKDPEHLAMMEKLSNIPHSGCGTSSKMKKEENFQINLKRSEKSANA